MKRFSNNSVLYFMGTVFCYAVLLMLFFWLPLHLNIFAKILLILIFLITAYIHHIFIKNKYLQMNSLSTVNLIWVPIVSFIITQIIANRTDYLTNNDLINSCMTSILVTFCTLVFSMFIFYIAVVTKRKYPVESKRIYVITVGFTYIGVIVSSIYMMMH